MAIGKVLLVAGSANFSTRDVWEGYRHALDAAGVRVVPYPTFSFLKVLSADAVCNDVIGTALDVENAFDAVIFVDGLHFRGKRARVPRSIRRAGIPTVLIATDDPYETLPDVESLYTHRFTNEIRCAGRGVTYLPTATLELPAIPPTARPAYDVSFLGSVFEDRVPLLVAIAEACEREGWRFLVAGKFPAEGEPFARFRMTDVRRRTIDTLEKWEIYSQSRVTLNVFRETDRPADSPSPRIFEVTAFGQAALLTGPRRAEVTATFGDDVLHFDTPAEAVDVLRAALEDDTDRRGRVERARATTLAGHLYEHRVASLLESLRADERGGSGTGDHEDRVAWIIGCGRTGSTWLAEMLGDLPGVRRWHEPYFGRFLRHLQDRPEDIDRRGSFFARRHADVWVSGLRNLFFEMVRDRYPRFGEHALAVKEVNTPELYPWLRTLFPTGRVILLARDPYDVLDSYLDLQKPGSWNDRFGDGDDPLSTRNVRRTAKHIADSMDAALNAFEAWPLEQRLRIDYEELLTDAAPGLRACCDLLSTGVSDEDLAAVVEQHDFTRYRKTGQLEFRRQGRASGWRTSENLQGETLRLAESILGPLRRKLGYK